MQLNLDAVGKAIELKPFQYSWKETALYALGLGMGTECLDYTWEGGEGVKVLPSFAVIPTQPVIMKALAQVNANFKTLVHGAQTIKMHAAIAAEGVFHSRGQISEVQDKGKGAVVIIDTETRDASGTLLFETSWSIFCRGQGDFGGSRGESVVIPEQIDEDPIFSVTYETSTSQALIYRLSGDLNPLHVDPELATKVGFKAPILHGLCTYGVATRAALEHLANDQPERLRAFTARFSQVVYPGDALTVRGYRSTQENTYRLEVLVGDTTVLSHGVVEVTD
ncbi:MAG: MaoC/PaaZ C-terminal domain-containing protein [Bradymonadia bacterium]